MILLSSLIFVHPIPDLFNQVSLNVESCPAVLSQIMSKGKHNLKVVPFQIKGKQSGESVHHTNLYAA